MILTPTTGALAIPDDALSLAEAATKALTLDRADCRRRAESFCDAEVMVDGYETVYRRALGGTLSEEILTLDDANSFLPEAN
jgi:hypothetical protein